MYHYKLTSQNCFSSISEVQTSCVSIFICFKIFFLNFSLISPLTYWLVRSMLFIFQMLVNLPAFLLLISSFKLLCLRKILGMILILNLLRLVLWLIICSVLGNVPCTLEKNVYSVAVGWNIQSLSLSQGSVSVQATPLGVCPLLTQVSFNTLLMKTASSDFLAVFLFMGFIYSPQGQKEVRNQTVLSMLKLPSPSTSYFTDISVFCHLGIHAPKKISTSEDSFVFLIRPGMYDPT